MRTAVAAALLMTILMANSSLYPPQGVRPLQAGPGGQLQPKIWGSLVVWTDYRSPTPTIALFDSSSAAFSLLPAPSPNSARLNPALSDSLLVWEEGCPSCPHDIFALDLPSHQILPIATSPADESSPAVSGRTIVWRSFDGSTHSIIALDLPSGLTTTIASHPYTPNFSFGRPLIDGPTVLFAHSSGRSSSLFAFDLPSRSLSHIADIPSPTPEYALSGPFVVFTSPALTLFHLPTQQSRTLSHGWLPHAPAIHGNLVLWAEGQNFDASQFDIYGFDIATNQPFLVSNHPANETAPALFGERVVWQREENGLPQIVSLDLAGKRPPIPRAP